MPHLETGGYKIISDTNGRTVQLDSSTYSIQVIDYSHHEIHSGSSYSQCGQTTIANAGTYSILIVTPDTTKWAHIIDLFRATAEINVKIYEGTTTSNNGTTLNIFNINRNSSNTAGVTAFHTPTVTDNGTLICEKHFGSSTRSGGEARGDSEWVLKQNTKYLFLITNEAAGNNDVSWKLSWYEHTNKE